MPVILTIQRRYRKNGNIKISGKLFQGSHIVVNDLFVSGFFFTERGFEDLQIVDKDNGVLVTGKRDMIFDFFTEILPIPSWMKIWAANSS